MKIKTGTFCRQPKHKPKLPMSKLIQKKSVPIPIFRCFSRLSKKSRPILHLIIGSRLGAAGTAGDPRELGEDNDEGDCGEMRDVHSIQKGSAIAVIFFPRLVALL